MILVFENQEDLIKAFVNKGGKLNGYTPSRMFDSSKLTYPIQVKVSEGTKTFWLHKETSIKATKKLSKNALIGIICGSTASIALIIGLLCYFLI